jgi:hypothetical protein
MIEKPSKMDDANTFNITYFWNIDKCYRINHMVVTNDNTYMTHFKL